MTPKRGSPTPGFADLVGVVEPVLGPITQPTGPVPRPTSPERRRAAARGAEEQLHVRYGEDGVVGWHPRLSRQVAERLLVAPPVPASELDLHRLQSADARLALRRHVWSARRRQQKTLLVISGRGRHSGHAGAVLPDVVIETLTQELAAYVAAFATAPAHLGGAGALIIQLLVGDLSSPRRP